LQFLNVFAGMLTTLCAIFRIPSLTALDGSAMQQLFFPAHIPLVEQLCPVYVCSAARGTQRPSAHTDVRLAQSPALSAQRSVASSIDFAQQHTAVARPLAGGEVSQTVASEDVSKSNV